MDGSILQTYLSDVLHVVTQSLLAPDIVLLLAFIGYALFCIGSIIAERFSERRHFNVVMPKFLAALMAAQEHEMPAVIEQSGLLNRQKVALLTVYDYRMLPGDALVALIRRLVSEEETRYDRITGRNNMAARVTPMLGLMGTLIPLGPGIQAPQTHVHRAGDAIQPSHPLLSPSPPALNLSQHQGLFQHQGLLQ